MGTIRKRADELQPGEVIISIRDTRRVILATGPAPSGCVVIVTAELGDIEGIPHRSHERAGQMLRVEAPEPTVTADDLALLIDAARIVLAKPPVPVVHVDTLQALLDRLDPPAPPTLAEALAALGLARDALLYGRVETPTEVRTTLDRARRAGLL